MPQQLGIPMFRTKVVLACAFFTLLAMVAAPAWADGVPITNATFETFNPLTLSDSGGIFNAWGIPGWTTTGGTATGSWQPNSTSFSSPLPSCCTVGYTNGGSISQILSATVLPDTFYTLSVFVGNRLQGFTGNYTIALWAGNTALCSFFGNSASIIAGTFADETCTYQSGSSVPLGDLSIVLSSNGQPGVVSQLDVDNVSLTTGVSTPEPGSLALTAVGLLCVIFAFRRKQAAALSA